MIYWVVFAQAVDDGPTPFGFLVAFYVADDLAVKADIKK
jgi:hypothetical protein